MLHKQGIEKNYIARWLVACGLLLACFLSSYASRVSIVPSDYLAHGTNALAQNILSTHRRSPNSVDVQSHKSSFELRVAVDPQQDIDSYEEIAHSFFLESISAFELRTQQPAIATLSFHCPRAPPAA